MIFFKCKNCGEQLDAPESMQNDCLQCSSCGELSRVPVSPQQGHESKQMAIQASQPFVVRLANKKLEKRQVWAFLLIIVGAIFAILFVSEFFPWWRTYTANADVDSLTTEAIVSIKAGDINTAKEKIAAAMLISHSNILADAQKLESQIDLAIDPNCIRTALIKLPDKAFCRFQKTKEIPLQFVTGYEALDTRTADLARVQLEEITMEREQLREKEIARKAMAAKAKFRKERKERIEGSFSIWNGSHCGLTNSIKASMNDPKSYEHVETAYWDMGDYLVVKTTFRGKNAFGGVVINWVKAKVDLDGNVLSIIEQGP